MQEHGTSISNPTPKPGHNERLIRLLQEVNRHIDGAEVILGELIPTLQDQLGRDLPPAMDCVQRANLRLDQARLWLRQLRLDVMVMSTVSAPGMEAEQHDRPQEVQLELPFEDSDSLEGDNS